MTPLLLLIRTTEDVLINAAQLTMVSWQPLMVLSDDDKNCYDLIITAADCDLRGVRVRPSVMPDSAPYTLDELRSSITELLARRLTGLALAPNSAIIDLEDLVTNAQDWCVRKASAKKGAPQ